MSFNEWKEVTLEDVVDILGDGLHGTPKYDESGEYYFINGNNLNGKIVINDKTKRVNIEEYEKHKKPLNERTIFVSINGTLGNVAEYNGEKVMLGKSACYFNVKNAYNKDYVKYIMHSPLFKSYLKTHSTGTTIKNMGLKQMRAFQFMMPPIEEQTSISKILSDVDKKIETNNQINKTLENMAQSIFKQWFVDFEFPNEEGEPYKSSGGEMVESELGMIPVGWEIKALYDLGDYINGAAFKGKDYTESGLPIIKIAELKNGIIDSTKYTKTIKNEKYLIYDGDILFSWSGNPKTSIDTFIWHKGDGILNQHIFKVIPTMEGHKYYLYNVLKHLNPVFERIASNKQTTGLGHVTVKDMKNLYLAIPSEDVIFRYNQIAKDIYNKFYLMLIENQRLNKLRDTLLPKLMSGEIRVPLEDN